MEFTRKTLGVIFDLRAIVGLSGIILSVLMHELFHIFMHWTEIESIRLFSDSEAIVEVMFAPSVQYNLAVEEALAYAVTMVTLILTAMLISDVTDARQEAATDQTLLAKEFYGCYPPAGEQKAREHLSGLLGIQRAS